MMIGVVNAAVVLSSVSLLIMIMIMWRKRRRRTMVMMLLVSLAVGGQRAAGPFTEGMMIERRVV